VGKKYKNRGLKWRLKKKLGQLQATFEANFSSLLEEKK
jgi:hypothetical protein